MAMSDCLTCGNSTLGRDPVFVISDNREIQNALYKHFWFDEEQCRQRLLCYECWHQIEDFHRFYCEVRKLYTRRPLCYQTPLEVKQEIFPADLVREVAAEQADEYMVADNGEICSNKYDNPQVDVTPESPGQPSEYKKAKEDIKYTDAPQSSKKRPRLQRNEKDAVQEYVIKNMILNCDTCSERIETFELLQRHSMMKHAKHATVVCCNSNFSDGSRFVSHIQYHLNPDLFRCEYCFQRCISRDALKKHLRKNHAEHLENPISDAKKTELSVMRTEIVKEGPSGMQEGDVSKNMNNSENEDEDDDDSRQKESKRSKPFALTEEEKAQVQMFVEKNRKLECDICSERYMRFQDLLKHSIEKHNNTQTGLCCNRKFASNYRFVAHMLNHVNPERFKCTECSKIFPSWEVLGRHIRRVHTSDCRYSCYICNRKFQTKTGAMRHVANHEERSGIPTDDEVVDKLIADNFNLRCDTCQKQHDSYQALQKHSMDEHGRRAAVICCKKKMRHRPELVDHHQYHQDPNAFQCKICLKTFHHSTALGHHMKHNHHAEWENTNSAKVS